MKFLAIVLFVVFASKSALASNWIAYNAGQNQCVLASQTSFSSPQDFEDGARQEGIFDDLKIVRDNNGGITMVAITVTTAAGGKSDVLFFSSMAQCQRAQALIEQSGDAASPNELR